MTSPAPSNPNASPLVTFLGVGAGAQVATIFLYFLQASLSHPLPEPVSNAITGLVAGLVAFGLHKWNNANQGA